MIPSKWRGWLYVVALASSVVIGVLVALGVVEEANVLEVITVVGNVIAALAALLARLNLSPDSTVERPEVTG